MEELELAEWRERVDQLHLYELDLAGFRARRDGLFASHLQSPIEDRTAFTGLR